MEVAICADLEWCSLLLAGCGSRLGLGDTSAFLDSALDFLSLLSASLPLNDVPVLYNNGLLKNCKIFEGLVYELRLTLLSIFLVSYFFLASSES